MTDTLRDTIRQAMDESTKEPEATDAPEIEAAQDDPEPEAEPKDAEPEASEGEGSDKSRDDKGRFAKKNEPDIENTDQPSAETSEVVEKTSHRPPLSWSPEAKASFATLPDAVQAAIAKRETEIDQGLRQKGESLKRYEPLENVIAPYREKWSMRGVDEATAVKQLLAASDWLERNPREALTYLAQQYGVSLGQQASGQQGYRPAQPDPQVQTLQQQLQQLQQYIESQTRAQEEGRKAEILSQIETFRADPANIYFDNVKSHMGALLDSGQAKDLQEAYDQAVWANPETRALLIKDQETKRAKDAQAKAREKAENAKKAAVSVTGAPGLGSSANGKAQNMSIRESIQAAISDVAGRA